jgi:hypothetical protein
MIRGPFLHRTQINRPSDRRPPEEMGIAGLEAFRAASSPVVLALSLGADPT